MCHASRPTFHIADPGCLVSPREIRHRPVGSKAELSAAGWLPLEGPVSIGLTSVEVERQPAAGRSPSFEQLMARAARALREARKNGGDRIARL